MRVIASILVLFLFLFPSCKKSVSVDNPSLILRYADNQRADYPTSQAAIFFASLVKEKTGGEIEIEVYADGVLGGETETLEQIQFGGIDISRFSLGTLSDLFPNFALLQLPYLYEDAEHMWRVLDGELGQEFLQSTEGKDLYGLCWLDAGARSFYSSSPINTPEDLIGKKIRVQESDLMSQIIELLGAEALQISYDDVYSALKQNIIDGAENNFPSYMFMEHYQVAKYFYIDEHFRLPEIVLMSKNAKEKIEKIDPSFLPIIYECAKEASLYERDLWSKATQDAYEKAIEAECIIVKPTEEDIAILKEKMNPIYDKLDTESTEVIKKIHNL